MSTPTQPANAILLTALSKAVVAVKSGTAIAWLRSTRSMAAPRRPSSAGL